MSLIPPSTGLALNHQHQKARAALPQDETVWDTTPISIDGPSGWESARISLRAEKCPWHLTLLNGLSGQVIDHVIDCDSWTHRACAEAKAKRHLLHIGTIFSREEMIWVAHSDYDPALPSRIRQRRHGEKRRSGSTAECFWVRRPTFVFIFSTAALPGSKEPCDGEWMNPQRAYGVARTVMWLPGIGDLDGRKAINYSQGWRPKSRSTTGIYTQIAIGLKPKDSDLVRLAYELLGEGSPIPELGGGWKRPFGVDQKEWIAALAAANGAMSRSDPT